MGIITDNIIYAIICIFFGILFAGLGIFIMIRNGSKGVKILDGKVIGINYDNHSIRIRYKINKNIYQDIDYYKKVYFMSGNIPPIGLKVTVKVNKDDLYKPLSVLILSNFRRITRSGFLNNSRFLGVITVGWISLLFIVGGILLLIE